jgi:hypothetical protein
MAEASETTPATTTPEANKCSKEGCKRPYRAKGYCVTHYKLWRRGELEGHKARYKLCSKEACKKAAGRYGLCDEHRGSAKEEAAAAPPAAASPTQ